MKISFKQVLAVSALAVASTSAFADVALPTSGNGELTLYVWNQTTGAAYARGLQVNIDNVLTQAAIVGGGYDVSQTGANNQPIYNVNFSLPTVTADANLTAFLSSAAATDVVTWSVQGADSTGNGLGNRRYVTTSATNFDTGSDTANSALSPTGWGQLNGLQSADNLNIAGTTIGDGASTTLSTYGTTNAHNWYSTSNPESQNALGSASNLYLFSSTSTINGAFALVFTLSDLTLSSTGLLSSASTAPVPVPAALWLLLSGLSGLGVIGRRKQA